MESTWAVAAQYCPHELGLRVNQLGHYASKQISSGNNKTEQLTIGVDHSQSDIDNDCPYCHLGSMKAMVSILSFSSIAAVTAAVTTIFYSYPDVTPRHPERPNWLSAV